MPLIIKNNKKSDKVHKDFTKDGKLLLGEYSMCQFTKDNLENAIRTLKVAGYEFESENILCDVMWLSRYMDDKEVDGLYNCHFLATLCDKSVDIDVFMEKYERLGMETDITQVMLPESYFKIPLG